MDEERETNRLPTLEIECRYCHGTGLIPTHCGQRKCETCHGSGFEPTEAGQRILDLVFHATNPIEPDDIV